MGPNRNLYIRPDTTEDGDRNHFAPPGLIWTLDLGGSGKHPSQRLP